MNEPITYEWMEKMKFNKVYFDDMYKEEGYYYCMPLSDNKYNDLELVECTKNGIIEIGLFPYEADFRYRYTHEVINLYRAITGKELRHENV